MPGLRGSTDDLSAGLLTDVLAGRCLVCEKDAASVHSEDAIPVGGRRVEQALNARDTGVRDRDVKSAKSVDSRVDDRRDLVLLADVSDDADRPTSQLLDLVDELPPEQSSALRARVLHGRSYAEIAGHVDVSEAAIRQRVSRALAGLRKRMEER